MGVPSLIPPLHPPPRQVSQSLITVHCNRFHSARHSNTINHTSSSQPQKEETKSKTELFAPVNIATEPWTASCLSLSLLLCWHRPSGTELTRACIHFNQKLFWLKRTRNNGNLTTGNSMAWVATWLNNTFSISADTIDVLDTSSSFASCSLEHWVSRTFSQQSQF